MIFSPNQIEQTLINIIHKYCREEFALIRMTYTMLDKSTIDTSESIKRVLELYDVIQYNNLIRGQQYKKKALVLHRKGVFENIVSYYHPTAKGYKEYGDPRFWIYGLKGLVTPETLVYFTVFNGMLVAIPLIDHADFEKILINLFGVDNTDEIILNELLSKFHHINQSGWVLSIAPNRVNKKGELKSAPKDAGETFEQLIGISANNLTSADFKGVVELKTKRLKTKNMDTLFSMVPNWSISPVKSSREMIIRYGYPSTRYNGFVDLYVTVGNIPNNQGLFLLADDDNDILTQYYTKTIKDISTAHWNYNNLKDKLLEKHPKTLWVVVDECVREGKIYFRYIKAELTQRPIFAQFTSLINQGIVTYDWRGRVMPDGSNYKDKGHAFRLKSAYRKTLFGDTKEIDL